MFPRHLQCWSNSTTQDSNSSAVVKISRVTAYLFSLTDPFPNPLQLHQSGDGIADNSQSLRSKSQLTNQIRTHKSITAPEICEWSRSVHDSLQDVGTPLNSWLSMELILWQNNLNLNCVHLNYWQVLFNKTEYYMGFKIVLNLILILNLNFFYLNIEHLKFNTIVFF